MGRPAGRDLGREEAARLRKLRRMAGDLRYDGDATEARAELRAAILAAHDTGASVRTLAIGLGVVKSRAGQLLVEARGTTTGARR